MPPNHAVHATAAVVAVAPRAKALPRAVQLRSIREADGGLFEDVLRARGVSVRAIADDIGINESCVRDAIAGESDVHGIVGALSARYLATRHAFHFALLARDQAALSDRPTLPPDRALPRVMAALGDVATEVGEAFADGVCDDDEAASIRRATSRLSDSMLPLAFATATEAR